jgi:RNase P/RNase MRP subunit p29
LSRYKQPPPLEGLRREIARARQQKSQGLSGGFVRETYRLTRHEARKKAREWFSTWPKAAYWTEVESWRLVPGDGDTIEFTMRRLPTAD